MTRRGTKASFSPEVSSLFRTSTHTPNFARKSSPPRMLNLEIWRRAYVGRRVQQGSDQVVSAALHPPIYALTSLCMKSGVVDEIQLEAVRSWRSAGMNVVSFNHPSEIAELERAHPDVTFVSILKTGRQIFRKHYAPIQMMLKWAISKWASVMIINADVVLRMSSEQLDRLRNATDRGLAYLVRFNHDGNEEKAEPEAWGIDGFLFHGRCTPVSFSEIFVMGQPAWDWWLPCTFVRRKMPVYAIAGAVALHRRHAFKWTPSTYKLCVDELTRMLQSSPNEIRIEIDRASEIVEVK